MSQRSALVDLDLIQKKRTCNVPCSGPPAWASGYACQISCRKLLRGLVCGACP